MKVLATARLVRPAYRPAAKPDLRSYEAMLEEDLARALDEIERLKVSLQRAHAALGSATARLNREIGRHQAAPAPSGEPAPRQPLVEKIRRLKSPGRVTLAPDVELDGDAWRMSYPGGVVTFSPTEWLLFRALVVERGAVVPLEQLELSVREASPLVTGPNHILRSSFSRIRTKLRQAGVADLMTTVPYSGYRLEAQP